MTDLFATKPVERWYTSRGVMGGLVASASGLAGLAGIIISAEEQETIVVGITSGIAAISGIISAYGRWKATRKLSK
jgi:hypothetical protein